MKRKVLVILGIIFLLVIVVGLVIKLTSKEEEKKENNNIPIYDADVICSLSGVDTFEDENEEYSIKAYLTVKDDLVTKAILVGLSTDTGNLVETQNIMNDYNKIQGIKASASVNNDTLITEVEYDYETIDLDEVKSKLGYLLIDDSIFLKVDSIPVTLGEYQKYELQEYVCK